MIIDVHAHLDFVGEDVLERIDKDEKIKLVITNSANLESCKKNLELARRWKKIYLAVGLYPEPNLKREDFNEFKKFVLENRGEIVALGEIGLDLYHTKENFDIQKEVFIKQLELAREIDVPVIIHTRKAEKEVIEILEDFKDLKIILHCFSGNFKLVKRAVEIGCYFSIPASIVRSEHFQKMIVEIPRDRILTETDTPYLSPYKEKRNEPSFIRETIKKISEIWDVPSEEVEEVVEKNFWNIFKGLVRE